MLKKRTTLPLIPKKAQKRTCILGCVFLTAFLFFSFRNSERLREEKRRHTEEKMGEESGDIQGYSKSASWKSLFPQWLCGRV